MSLDDRVAAELGDDEVWPAPMTDSARVPAFGDRTGSYDDPLSAGANIRELLDGPYPAPWNENQVAQALVLFSSAVDEIERLREALQQIADYDPHISFGDDAIELSEVAQDALTKSRGGGGG